MSMSATPISLTTISGHELTTDGETVYIGGEQAGILSEPKRLATPVEGRTHYLTMVRGSWKGKEVGLLPEVVEHINEIRERVRVGYETARQTAQQAKLDAARAQVPDGYVLAVFARSQADGWITMVRVDGGEEMELPKGAIAIGAGRAMTPTYYAVPLPVPATAEAPAPTTPAPAPVVESAPVAVPAAALEAFRRYRGDEEAAWEVEDEDAWASIRQYGAAIKRQGLATAAPRRGDLRSDEWPTHHEEY